MRRRSTGSQGLTLISQLWLKTERAHSSNMESLQDLGRGIMSVYWPDTTGQRRKHQQQLPAKPQNKVGDVGRRGSWRGAAAQMKSEGLMWKHLNETKSLFMQGCLCGVHRRRKLGHSDTESRQIRGFGELPCNYLRADMPQSNHT